MVEYVDRFTPDEEVSNAIKYHVSKSGPMKPWTLMERVEGDSEYNRKVLKYLLKKGELEINADGDIRLPRYE